MGPEGGGDQASFHVGLLGMLRMRHVIGNIQLRIGFVDVGQVCVRQT